MTKRLLVPLQDQRHQSLQQFPASEEVVEVKALGQACLSFLQKSPVLLGFRFFAAIAKNADLYATFEFWLFLVEIQ